MTWRRLCSQPSDRVRPQSGQWSAACRTDPVGVSRLRVKDWIRFLRSFCSFSLAFLLASATFGLTQEGGPPLPSSCSRNCLFSALSAAFSARSAAFSCSRTRNRLTSSANAGSSVSRVAVEGSNVANKSSTYSEQHLFQKDSSYENLF